MATFTAAQIGEAIAQDFRDSEPHGRTCGCCQRADGTHPDLETMVYREALYAVSRFRPGEGYLTDETDDSIDELVESMTTAGVAAVHEALARVASQALAGKVVAA